MAVPASFCAVNRPSANGDVMTGQWVPSEPQSAMSAPRACAVA